MKWSRLTQNSVHEVGFIDRRSKLAIWHSGWNNTSQLCSSFHAFLTVNTRSSGLASVRWHSQTKCHVSNINVDDPKKSFFYGPLINPPVSLIFSLFYIESIWIPSSWRGNHITPLPKKQHFSHAPCKFRTITATLIELKVCEQFILAQNQPFFDEIRWPIHICIYEGTKHLWCCGFARLLRSRLMTARKYACWLL